MPIFGDDGGRRAKEKQAKADERLPPGQSLTIKMAGAALRKRAAF